MCGTQKSSLIKYRTTPALHNAYKDPNAMRCNLSFFGQVAFQQGQYQGIMHQDIGIAPRLFQSSELKGCGLLVQLKKIK